MDAVNPVLAQKMGLTAPVRADDQTETQAPTPMRQMRRALGRAADHALNISASVLGIAQEDTEAEDLISTGPEGWVVLGLRDGDHTGLTGLFLMDPKMRSGVIEMQTMGNLLPVSEDQRAVTRTDAVMCAPFADQLLKELAEVGFGSDGIDPAAYDIGPMEDLRTAGLVMMQGVYRCWRITVQMGGGDHQGDLLIALRPEVAADAPEVVTSPNWNAALRDALQDAPAQLDAVLSRMVLPISKIEAFEVGQVLQLAGTTVGSVTLVGPGGEKVSTARLGQVAGKRAVRVEQAQIELQDDPPKMAPRVQTPTIEDHGLTGEDAVSAPDLVDG